MKPENTYVVGSPMAEVLDRAMPSIEASTVLEGLGLEAGRYILLSAHREENIDIEENFFSLMGAVNAMAKKYDVPVLYSCHPRSAKMIERRGFKFDSRVIQHKPLGFFDYNQLQRNALCVVSDSGTLPEEACVLQVPGRERAHLDRTARGHGCRRVCVGSITSEQVLQAVDLAVAMHANGDDGVEVPAYADRNVAAKVMKLVQSYTGIVNKMVWRKA